MNLLTPDDFGAVITLEKDIYDDFKRNREPLEQGETMIGEFEHAITAEIENELNKKMGNSQHSKVVKISFSFDNNDVLALLEKRAKYLEKPEFDKANEIEDKISGLYKSVEYDRLVKPNHAFVIFETEEGLEGVTKVAEEFSSEGLTAVNTLGAPKNKPYTIQCENEMLANGNLELIKAVNPSTIVWENCTSQSKLIFWRRLWVAILMIIISVPYFFVFLRLTTAGLELKYMKMTPGVVCSDIYKQLGPNIEYMAGKEYIEFNNTYGESILVTMKGGMYKRIQ